MAEIKPFKGITYNQTKVSLGNVVAPPYDVIPLELQNELYEKSPYNVVRLILNKIKNTDTEKNNRYTRSARHLNKFLEDGALQPSNEPALYFYEQIFDVEQKKYNRQGIIVLIKIEDFETGKILPHERTLPKAQEDRFNLIKATGANFSSIFGLYSDKTRKTDGIIENSEMRLTEEVDYQGVLNRVSEISDANDIEKIKSALQDKIIYIADGHHRYKVALAYRDYMRERFPGAGPDAPWEFVLMTLVNTYSEGMVILPTHRMVKEINMPAREIVSRLSERFLVEEQKNLSDMLESLSNQDASRVLGLYISGRFFLLKLKDNSFLNDIPSGEIESIKNLSVTLLHELALGKCLDIPLDSPAKGAIKFEVDPAVAVRNADDKNFDAVFFLNPTKIEEVQKVAEEGQVMPQKSTYFYPKLVSGLVMRKIS